MVQGQKEMVKEALAEIEKIVTESNVQNDITYFNYHRRRFQLMGETVLSITPPGSTILDIGSHYLHTSLLFKLLGYNVTPMDVSAFGNLDFVQERAQKNGLSITIEDNLEKMHQLSQVDNYFDLIIFAEIFEHITFNPISFWKRIHELIKHNGKIYLTTPNSITIYAIARTLYNLLSFKGIGIGVNDIFAYVTYGHHWKEYSAYEIHRYFKLLNEGFAVTTKKITYKPPTKSTSLRGLGRALLISVSNAIPYFREAIEAVVQVDKSHAWKIEPPVY
jgi:2-polyprenyl-6-hydroxyphenyl methylase/3-demethylubiquinone-9 3-methyltransferase